jgi:type IV secretory pathway VirJ component
MVFLFSGAEGPTPALAHVAEVLAWDGAAVLLVDLPAYLKGLAASSDGCHYVVSELEELSKRQQRELRSDHYHWPILAGVGAGGTLAYAALAQSPAATVRGALAVDPAPALGTHVKLCEGAPASAAAGGGFAYAAPRQAPPGSLQLELTPDAREPERWRAVAGAVPGALLEASDSTDEVTLERTLRAFVRGTRGDSGESILTRLPITLIPAAAPGPLLAVIYSGDGGWRDLDKQIGEYLAARGVRVVGVDSLRYFWTPRTPEEVARHLGEILHAELGRPGAPQRAMLIGYSFGADILPFAWNRLAEADRRSLLQLSLLGLGSHAVFEFHVTGWLQRPDTSGLPILPELQRIDLAKVQCFYGADETDTLCPRLAARGAEVIGTTGGHHFDGDYTKLAQRILDGALKRTTGDQRAITPAMPPEMSAATSVRTKGTDNPLGAAR